MNPPAGLDTCFLVCGEHQVAGAQRMALPEPRIQIQNASCLVFKLWVSWEDPTPMAPGFDRILIQPAPQSGLADGGDQPTTQHLALELGNTESRQRKTGLAGKLACQSPNGHHDPGGKSGEVVPAEAAPPAQRGVA